MTEYESDYSGIWPGKSLCPARASARTHLNHWAHGSELYAKLIYPWVLQTGIGTKVRGIQLFL